MDRAGGAPFRPRVDLPTAPHRPGEDPGGKLINFANLSLAIITKRGHHRFRSSPANDQVHC
jgi:hypothetical protein